MSNPITLEDFYKLFQESERQRQETERILRESLERSREEFDRRLAEADRRAAEAEQRLARTEAIAAQTNQAVNSLSSRWGHFVENLVAPAVLRLFQERGIPVQEVYQRVKSARGSQNLEIDILAVNDDVAVVVEVKSRLTQDYVRRFLRNLSRFKTAFPHYGNYRIYAAMAAIEIDRDVDTYAENQGLFVIEQSGDSVYISSTPNFTPRTW